MSQPERIGSDPIHAQPIAPLGTPGQPPGAPARTPDGKTFNEILRTKVGLTIAPAPETTDKVAAEPTRESSIRWSAHATARLRQRGIELTDAQHVRLENAVDRAARKGSKDALVMMDDTAMVVSVKNRTVITALPKELARDNVFTNIDAAVIA